MNEYSFLTVMILLMQTRKNEKTIAVWDRGRS